MELNIAARSLATGPCAAPQTRRIALPSQLNVLSVAAGSQLYVTSPRTLCQCTAPAQPPTRWSTTSQIPADARNACPGPQAAVDPNPAAFQVPPCPSKTHTWESRPLPALAHHNLRERGVHGRVTYRPSRTLSPPIDTVPDAGFGTGPAESPTASRGGLPSVLAAAGLPVPVLAQRRRAATWCGCDGAGGGITSGAGADPLAGVDG